MQPNQILINEVEFNPTDLIQTFPDSFFVEIITDSDFDIPFPDHFIVPSSNQYQPFATRIMRQIAYRLETGLYQAPGPNHSIDDFRFESYQEMSLVIDFLCIDKDELTLIETDDDDEDNDDDDDSYDYNDIDEEETRYQRYLTNIEDELEALSYV